MTNLTFYSLIAITLLIAAKTIQASTATTRGRGSWAEDQRRLMVAGGLYALSIIAAGMAVAACFVG